MTYRTHAGRPRGAPVSEAKPVPWWHVRRRLRWWSAWVDIVDNMFPMGTPPPDTWLALRRKAAQRARCGGSGRVVSGALIGCDCEECERAIADYTRRWSPDHDESREK